MMWNYVLMLILLIAVGMAIFVLSTQFGDRPAPAILKESDKTEPTVAKGAFEISGGGTEYEAKWLDIDIDSMRKKIENEGGTLVHDEKPYRRYVFDLPKGYARTREEYDDSGNLNVTMTAKIYKKGSPYPEEYEVATKNSIEECRDLLRSLVGKEKAYHETRRIKYHLEPCHEIVIDTVPGLAPYMEIDCHSEADVFDVAKKLGLDKKDARYGPYGQTFAEEYGLDQKWFDDKLAVLDFKTFDKELGPKIKKNKDKFDDIVGQFKE